MSIKFNIPDDPSVWSEDLVSSWSSVTVVNPTTLLLRLPESYCTDMSGAIRFAKRLLEEVDTVIVQAGDQVINRYCKDKDEVWKARSFREKKVLTLTSQKYSILY